MLPTSYAVDKAAELSEVDATFTAGYNFLQKGNLFDRSKSILSRCSIRRVSHLSHFGMQQDHFSSGNACSCLCDQQLHSDHCRSHHLSAEEFQKEADAVLDFLQDKLEEYVEDNDISGGDVEQGV